MTNKRKRVYESIIVGLSIILMALCAYMGITAVQKSMRLNVGFSAVPSIKVLIQIEDSQADDGYRTIFRNDENTQIGAGLEIHGNTLQFTNSFADSEPNIGASFVLKFTNLMSNTGLKASVVGNSATANPTYVTMKASGTGLNTATMTISGNSALSTLQLSFVEYHFYSVSVASTTSNYEFSGASDVAENTEYTANIKAKPGYNLSITVTRDGGTTTTLTAGQGNDYVWNSSTGALTIYASAVTGNITISCSTSANSYAATFNGNGGTDGTGITADFGTALGTLPTSTRTGYNFNGWYTATSGGTKITESTTMPLNGATYYAQWSAITYSVAYNKNGGSGTMSNSSHTYNSAKNLTANAYTREGYNFTGWNTKSDGSGTAYADKASVKNLSSTQGATVTLYAQWTERIYTITFTSTTNNLQVNNISGTTATKITSLQMKKAETKNVVVTSTTAGQWSRSATYSVTSGSAKVSFDSLTGDLTITNPTADTTINVSVSASNTFRPWTYGTYVNNEGSAIGDKVSYNTVHYPAFEGYKYIQFQNKSEITTTNHKGTTQTVPLRWMVIGAGSSVSSATMKNATRLITTAYAGTVNGTAGVNDELTANQVLLLSEQTLLSDAFDDNDNDSNYDSGVDLGDWNASTLKTWLSSTVSTGSPYNGGVGFMTATGLSTYSTYIINPQYTNSSGTKVNGLITAWYTGSTMETKIDTSSKIFLLGSRYGYVSVLLASTYGDARTYAQWSSQNFVVEDYLGSSTTSWTYQDSVRNKSVTETVGDYTKGTTAETGQKLASFSGAKDSYWWLRSGSDYYDYRALCVTNVGRVDDDYANRSNGVRPSFILNLA